MIPSMHGAAFLITLPADRRMSASGKCVRGLTAVLVGLIQARNFRSSTSADNLPIRVGRFRVCSNACINSGLAETQQARAEPRSVAENMLIFKNLHDVRAPNRGEYSSTIVYEGSRSWRLTHGL